MDLQYEPMPQAQIPSHSDALTTDSSPRVCRSQPAESGTPLWNMTHRVDALIRGAAMKLKNALTGTVLQRQH